VTVPVGRITDDVQRLLRVTREALDLGIAEVRLGGRISDIGHAIQRYVEQNGFSVVREFVGHGIGAALHEEPQIANYGEPGRGPRLAEGMVLAIEPMVNMGRPNVRMLADGWTAVTRDGSLSAHFEHTVAVTKDGPDVLTCARRRRRRRAMRRLLMMTSPSSGRRRSEPAAGRRHGAQGAPHGLYRVVSSTSGTSSRTRRRPRRFIRVLVGDRVQLELSPRDLTRGRIVAKVV
jgi:hypothetical protein